jgi:hypothetical protein
MKMAGATGSMVLLGAVLAALPTQASATPPSLDVNNRQSVETAYMDALAASKSVPDGWTGSEQACNPGALSPEFLQGQLAVVNFGRAMTGLPAVGLSQELTTQAQLGAFAWTFGDQCGMEASNYPGHKVHCTDEPTWVMLPNARVAIDPFVTEVGIGWVPGGGDLAVRHGGGRQDSSPWMAWPSAGYFPEPLEQSSGWYLAGIGADFSNASVRMTDPATGQPVANARVKAAYDAGDSWLGYLQWEVSQLETLDDVTVTVEGIVRAGQTVSHSYTVHLFKPMMRTLGQPTYSGVPQVGKTLRATSAPVMPASMESSDSEVSLSWWRDGVRVGRGTTYKVRVDDLGRSLVLRQRSSHWGFSESLVYAAPTAAVQPATRLRPMGIKLEGVRQVGRTIRVFPEWTYPQSKVRQKVQWYIGGRPIPGATKTRLVLRRQFLKIPKNGSAFLQVRVKAQARGQHASQSRTYQVYP